MVIPLNEVQLVLNLYTEEGELCIPEHIVRHKLRLNTGASDDEAKSAIARAVRQRLCDEQLVGVMPYLFNITN